MFSWTFIYIIYVVVICFRTQALKFPVLIKIVSFSGAICKTSILFLYSFLVMYLQISQVILEKTNENYDKKNHRNLSLLMSLLGNATSPWGLGKEFYTSTRAYTTTLVLVKKPFPKIVSMVKLDIFSCNQYLLVKSLLFHISLFVPFLVGIEFIKNVKHLMMTNNSW